MTQKPEWLKTPLPSGKVFFDIKRDLRGHKLATVCEEAKCPNIGECWGTNTATFMVLGDTCTRACRFCHIKTNPETAPDPHEPEKVAASCAKMGLKYVVITMVNRDDLPDGGAEHVANVLREVKIVNPEIKIELLAGDFLGSQAAIATILRAKPDVYAHNVETVRRLTPRVRDRRAGYDQSLQVLAGIKTQAPTGVYTKSSLMLGLGETYEEVVAALQDLRAVGTDFVTLGQYMRPTKQHLSVKEWVHPDMFKGLGDAAKDMGFQGVAAGPLVRSSYRAREFFENAVR